VLVEVTLPDGGQLDLTLTQNGTEVLAEQYSYDAADPDTVRQSATVDTVSLETWPLTAAVRLADAATGVERTSEQTFSLGSIQSTGHRRAREAMEAARLQFVEAISTLYQRADVEALAALTAEDFDTDLTGLLTTIQRADSDITRARSQNVSELRPEIDAVRTESDLLQRIVRIQRRTYEALEESRQLYSAFGEREGDYRTRRENYERRVAEVRSRVRNRDPDLVSLYERIADAQTVVEYGPKVEQFQNELAAYERWEELARRTQDGLSTLRDGERAYDNNNRERAANLGSQALETFEAVRDELEPIGQFPDTGATHLSHLASLIADARFHQRRD
jgi:hypothetical protein